MKTVKEYILESLSVSDDAIWYRMGINVLNWMMRDQARNVIKKYGISKTNPRPGVIKYMKAVNPPLPKDSEEFIHRKSWDLDSLTGETEGQLMHMCYYDFANHVLKDTKREHDVLAVFQCSSKKPYYDNSVNKNNYYKPYGDYCDFACISNPGIIPIYQSQYYPYRYDEWNIPNEEKLNEIIDMTHKYRIVNMCRFIRFVRSMGYKQVLIAIGNEMKQWIFEEMLKYNVAGCKDWLTIVTDKSLRKYIYDKYPQLRVLISSRLMGLGPTRKRFEKDLTEVTKKVKGDVDGVEDAIKARHDALKESWDKPKYTIREHIDYKDFMKTFKDEIDYNMKNGKVDKGDNNLYYKSYYWTVLDLLMMAMDGDLVEDIDGEYWSMIDWLKDHNDFKMLGDSQFVFYYKPLTDNDDLKEADLLQEATEMRIIKDSTRSSMPKLNIKKLFG